MHGLACSREAESADMLNRNLIQDGEDASHNSHECGSHELNAALLAIEPAPLLLPSLTR